MGTMNSFENKSFLAQIRGSDFAHPGEEGAIDLVLSHVRPEPHQTVLDAGCGLGATADAIGQKTGAVVVGVDLDADAMSYANTRYQDSQFIPGDITKLDALSLPKVDVIYAFNSLYACADLDACFAAFRAVAKANARVAVFDYVAYDAAELAKADCLPSSVQTMTDMRQAPERQGWACTAIINLDNEYAAWYRRFLERMDDNRDALTASRSLDFFVEVRKKYADMCECLELGVLGGAIHIYSKQS
ncbi:MAG: methyltransferase domain-containing protein [Pseudomonadota bacterium]